jgi:glutamate-ammonia-ligase adenylyltransferase
LADLLPALLTALAASADPDQALTYFERYAKAQGNKAALFSYLKTSPSTLQLLTTVFGASPFLSQILIRNPEYVHWLHAVETLKRGRTRTELQRDLRTLLGSLRSKERQLDALRRFKRRELLALGLRDLLQLASVEQTTMALSILSDVLIQEVYRLCRKSLSERYGQPRSGFIVLGLGKLGGSELNFSSDVDLIYVAGSDTGSTKGPAKGRQVVTHAVYFNQLAQELTHALSEVTDEGYLFRVDLRLRPEGSAGRLVASFQQCRTYYRGVGVSSAPRAQGWERLAQMKARPIAGDAVLGRRFLKMIEPFIYQTVPASASEKLLDEVRKIKQLIDAKMAARGESQRNVKLGIGGIREVELAVQALQALHGGMRRALRARNTTIALYKLQTARLLTVDESRALLEGYWFLRNIEHKLQMVEEQQTHVLPVDPAELHRCAMRLGYRDGEEGKAMERFIRDLQRRTERVHEIFNDIMSGRRLASLKQPRVS